MADNVKETHVKIEYDPFDKQRLLHEAACDEVLYGGAAGGGKSWALLFDAIWHCLQWPTSEAILFRRTFPELERSLIQRSQKIIPRSIATYSSALHRWKFINGSQLWFGYIDNEYDLGKYQSAEYSWIGFDELTHFEEGMYTYMLSRLRDAEHPNIPKKIRSATNPGSVGHAWVRRRFIDIGEPMKVYHVGVGPKGFEKKMTRQFIPARLEDNPAMTQFDPDYETRLMSLPDKQRRALRFGDWDIFEGQAFGEWNQDIHVIDDFNIPDNWEKIVGVDWGYAKPFYIGWIAIDNDDNRYLYRELYGCKTEMYGEADSEDQGVLMAASEVARIAREKEKEWEDIRIRYADGSMWNKSGQVGPGNTVCIADEFMAEKFIITPAVKDRIQRKMLYHEALRPDPDTAVPRFRVFKSCRGFIRTFPQLILDKNNPEDIDTKTEDHPYDGVGYALMHKWGVSRKEFKKRRRVNISRGWKVA